MPASLGRMFFSVGPLNTGLIIALFNLTIPRHSLNLPFAFRTSVMLLHHLDVSSMLSETII